MYQSSSDQAVYRFDGFELKPAERGLFRDGGRVPLTPRAFELLATLVMADGRLLSKEELLERVWADAVVEEGNLNRTISSIRKALGDTRRKSRYIETVPKAGYRFISRVERATGRNVRLRVADAETDPVNPPLGRTRESYRWVLLVIGGLLFVLVPALLYFFAPGSRGLTAGPGLTDTPTLVRLTNNQYDEDQAEWTAAGQIRFIRYVTATRAESWIMDADGTDQRRANEKIKSLLTGQWSPDGKRVVFIKDGESPRNVYLANADGSDERRLPLNYPPSAWSPDGTKFVYGSPVAAGNHDIFVYDIESRSSVNLTNTPTFEADPLFSPDGKQILFVGATNGSNDAYVMDVDGSNVRRLTDHPAVDAFPVLSPDGTQVVFDSNREGENSDIYLKNLDDDAPPVKLTQLASNEEHRANCWSPDGTRMVITSDQGGKNNIYVMQVEPYKARLFLADPEADLQYPSWAPDGSKLVYQAKFEDRSMAVRWRNVISADSTTIFRTEPNPGSFALTPVFSPDSSRIGFTARIGGNSEICTIDLAGDTLINLTKNPSADANPRFSPDAQSIYFQSNREGSFERFHLFRMDIDGGEPRRVTGARGYEFEPFITPNGTIVFSGDRLDATSKALDIRSVSADGSSGEEIIASRRFHDTQPAVSPDGKLIAFVSQADGNQEIYLVRADGSGIVRLTRHTADDESPAFSPDGRTLYFSSNRGGRYAIYEMPLSL